MCESFCLTALAWLGNARLEMTYHNGKSVMREKGERVRVLYDERKGRGRKLIQTNRSIPV